MFVSPVLKTRPIHLPPNTDVNSKSLRPSAGDVVDIYQREFLALRERLHSAEQENLRRSKELNLVLEEIKRAIAEKQALRDINRTWSSLSGQSAAHHFILLTLTWLSNLISDGWCGII